MARSQDASQQPLANSKASEARPHKEKPERAKAGTKQAVEARLKAVEHAKPEGAAEPIHEVEKTLFATRRFEQAVISPDGKRVAWVETLIGKDGAPSGNTAIYVSEIEAKDGAEAGWTGAGVGAADHEETNVAWSPDSKRIAFLSDAAKAGQRQLYVANVGGAAGSAGAAKKTDQREGVSGRAELVAGWEDDCGVVHGECHARVGAAGGGDSRDGGDKGCIF